MCYDAERVSIYTLCFIFFHSYIRTMNIAAIYLFLPEEKASC